MAVDGRGFEQIPDTQGVKFVYVRIGRADGITFVDSQSDRLAGFAQHGGDVLIGSGHAGAHIRDHDNGVRQFNADLCLAAHEFEHFTAGTGLNAAGVHQIKFPVAPLALAVDPVPGDTGCILHDGGALTGELIKEHGLSDVGPPNNGYEGFCHGRTSFLNKNLNVL